MSATEFFLQQLGNGLILGSAYALVAIGLTLVFGVLGVINLAQGEIFMVGAFAGLVCLEQGLGLPAALLAGAVCACIVGLLIERFALRPLPASIDPHIPLVCTIGAAVVLQQAAAMIFSTRQHAYPTPELLSGHMRLGSIQFDYINLFIISIALMLMATLAYLVRHTKMGLAIRAVAENPRTASLLGVNRKFVIAFVFGVSSALAGFAGVLVGIYFNNIGPFIGVPIAIKALAAVIFGGLGSIPGAVCASLIIGVAETMTVSYVASSWRDAVSFGVIILILLIRPLGLFGTPIVQKV
ncbi:branched-chain amino acid ABC transporter permease [Eoetvoesiella caeni]